jgi:hypothetical protein
MAPEVGKPIYDLPLIPATVLKSIASMSRSIRGSGPPPACFRPCCARTGTRPSAGMLTTTASAASSLIPEAAGKGGGDFLTPELARIARRETF